MSGDLERLLPHRPPMVLLDRVVECAGDRCVAQWTVAADSPWVEDGRLLRAAFLEIAAQTAAAGAGGAAAASGVRPGHGYLGAVADFRVHGDASPGDVLRSTAHRVLGFGRLSRVACSIERVGPSGAALVAEGMLTVAAAFG